MKKSQNTRNQVMTLSHQKQGRHNCLNEWHAQSGIQRYMEYGVAGRKTDGSQQV